MTLFWWVCICKWINIFFLIDPPLSIWFVLWAFWPSIVLKERSCGCLCEALNVSVSTTVRRGSRGILNQYNQPRASKLSNSKSPLRGVFQLLSHLGRDSLPLYSSTPELNLLSSALLGLSALSLWNSFLLFCLSHKAVAGVMAPCSQGPRIIQILNNRLYLELVLDYRSLFKAPPSHLNPN